MIHPFKLFGALAMSLNRPLLGLAFALAAAAALGPLLHPAPRPGAELAVAGDAPSPFASGAALRNLLF